MSRVCFLSLDNLFLVPYLKKYSSFVSNYDIIYWNRSKVKEENQADNVYEFFHASHNSFQKFLGYWLFSRFVKRILKNNKYDRLVVLHTPLAVLLEPFLVKHYKGRFLLDIRDYSYEHSKWFFQRETRLIANSGLNVISSQGYLSFLPTGNYIPVHNDNPISHEVIESARAQFTPDKQPIVISNIGLIRFHEQNKKLILAFKNDPRFQLRFIGKGALELADFCQENEVKNVVLTDFFEPSQTIENFCKSDVIFNLYGNNTPLLDYALSNKLYYAAQLGRPILVCPDTFMQVASNGFNHTMDLDKENLPENLYNFFTQIDKTNFFTCCDNFMQKVKNENDRFNHVVRTFLQD